MIVILGTRIQIRAGMDSGMPVIEEKFEKDGEKSDTGAQSEDGENREKPMSKFKMRQLGVTLERRIAF